MNAGLFAAAVLANSDPALSTRLADFRVKQADAVHAMTLDDQP